MKDKYKVSFIFGNINFLNDIFISILFKELKKHLKNEKNSVSLFYTHLSLNGKGGMNHSFGDYE